MRGRSLFIILLCFLIHLFSVYAVSRNDNGKPYLRSIFKFKIPFGHKYNYRNILVTRVIDGDTIELENGERVRLIGIDTPEIRYNKKLIRDIRRTKQDAATIIKLGRKSAIFTKNLVEDKRVRLEFDVEKRDKYGRLLAYVYLPDGRMVNEEILKAGYGQLYTIPPNVKYVEVFIKAQRLARQYNRGLWMEGGQSD